MGHRKCQNQRPWLKSPLRFFGHQISASVYDFSYGKFLLQSGQQLLFVAVVGGGGHGLYWRSFGSCYVVTPRKNYHLNLQYAKVKP